jgi:hypothetical protein
MTTAFPVGKAVEFTVEDQAVDVVNRTTRTSFVTRWVFR